MMLTDLRAANRVLTEYIEKEDAAHVKALKSPNVTPEKAHSIAIEMRTLDALRVKIAADVKRMERNQ